MATLRVGIIVGAAVNGALRGLSSVSSSVRILRDQTLNTQQRIDALGANNNRLMGRLALETAGVGLAIAGSLAPAIKFESAMADVKKVVDFKTPQGFKNLSKQLLDLTDTLPLTANELASIAASGGQLGVAEEDLKDFTVQIAKMATAFDMSAEESGDAMAKLANVYKIPIKNISILGDAINELSNSSPAKASDIVNALGRVGGIAKKFGLSELAAASLSNAFISLGKRPEVAGTAINGMLTKLMTADKQGKKFQGALKEIGTSAKTLKKDIAQNGEAALVSFLKKVNKMPKEKQMGILVDLFGLEYADDVAVLSGSVETLEGSIATLNKTNANGQKSFLGSMEKEFQARSETTENNLKLLGNGLTKIAITVGSIFLPELNKLVDSIKPVVTGIADWASANPELVQQGVKIVGMLVAARLSFLAFDLAIGGTIRTGLRFTRALSGLRGLLNFANSPTLMFIRSLGGLFNFANSPVLRLMRSLGRFAGILGGKLLMGIKLVGQAMLFLGRALLANPIILIVTGIALSAYLIYKYWKPISKFFKKLWGDAVGVFRRYGIDINNVVGNIWRKIKTAFDGGIKGVGALILNWSPVGLFYKAWAKVLSWFGVDLPADFTGFGALIIKSMTDSIKSTWELGKKIFNDIVEFIKHPFSSLAKVFEGFGGDLIDGLILGIKNKMEAAKVSITEFGSNLKGWFSYELGIRSPSRVFMGYGDNITTGAAIGIESALPKAKSAIKKLNDEMGLDASNKGFNNKESKGSLSGIYAGLGEQAPQSSNKNQEVGNITVNFYSTIHTTDKEGVDKTLKLNIREIEKVLEKIDYQRRRRSFA